MRLKRWKPEAIRYRLGRAIRILREVIWRCGLSEVRRSSVCALGIRPAGVWRENCARKAADAMEVSEHGAYYGTQPALLRYALDEIEVARYHSLIAQELLLESLCRYGARDEAGR